MSLVVNTNLAALTAQRNLSGNTNALRGNFEKLASGYRINRAADDAAGLRISEKLRAQIRGTTQAISNAQDGVNVLQVAEGALGTIQEHLQRIRELAVQAGNDTNGTTERNAIKEEIEARRDDINRIAGATKFNGKNLIGSQAPSTYSLQIGANTTSSTEVLSLSSALTNSRASALASALGSISLSTGAAARSLVSSIDTALNSVSSKRATIGSLQNRLTSAINSLSIQKENFTSAESRIRDLDVASETANLTRNQILQQASVSVLSQANSGSQLALRLLG